MCRSLVILIFILATITSCVAQEPVATFDPTRPCDVILHPAMLSVPFDELARGREEAEEWIMTQFLTVTVEFEPSRFSGEGNIGRFSWSEGDKGFSLYLDSVSQYIDQFQHSNHYPTLAHILRCFGDPEYYTLEMGIQLGPEMKGSYLQLWYPARGVRFEAITRGFADSDRFTADSPIAGQTRIMPAGTVEEMLRNEIPGSEQAIEEHLALLQKWPDSFRELPVDE